MKMKPLTNRSELEQYALSVSLPLLNQLPGVWDTRTPGSLDHVSYIASYMESFCRTMWGLAPILKHRQEPIYVQRDGQDIEVCQWFMEGIVNGLNPSSPQHWEKYLKHYNTINYANQLTTELAALTLGMVLNKKKLWDPLETKDKERIGAWLNELSVVAYRHSWPNNHYWFPIMIFLALKRLGMPYEQSCIDEGLVKLDAFYVGNGWYRDADFGRFDYYIPWSHHVYPLLWMILETEDAPGYNERKRKYLERTNAFLQYFPNYFDSTGLHVPFGRSLSYRFAASSLLPLASYHGCDIDPGLARKITLANIDYFRRTGGAGDGKVIVPGFTYPSSQHVENYISEGAPYWCAKTFLALLMKDDDPFWQAPQQSMPIERGEYSVKVPVENVHMVFQGDDEHSGVSLFNNTASYVQGQFYHKFNDMHSLYAKFVYNSRAGLGMSTRDNVSLDNMIGLETADAVMCSHRAKIDDLGMKGKVMAASHQPFSNDAGTRITTLMLPLPGGYHIRAHKVVMSQPYRVTEGGFSAGRWNDREESDKGSDWIALRTDEGYSWLRSYTPDAVQLAGRSIQPGMHLLCPIAQYPCYSTELLEPGTYVFVSSFFYSNKPDVAGDRLAEQGPTVAFADKGNRDRMTVTFKGEQTVLNFADFA